VCSDSTALIGWEKDTFGCNNYFYNYSVMGTPKLFYKYNKKLDDDFKLYNTSFTVNGKNDFINFSLIVNGNETEGILFDSRHVKNLSLDVRQKRTANFSKESTYYYQNNADKRKILFIYDFGNSIFYKADLNNKSRLMPLTGSDKIEDINSYMVDKGPGRKLEVIFISKSDKIINFKEIE